MVRTFQRLACAVAEGVGTWWAFLIALAVIAAWGAAGPLFGYSDSWQLVINTGTTIVTFLMVFLIQATQNRDSKAINLKLDELIRATKSARNVFAGLEDATDEELRRFQAEFRRLRQKGLHELDAAAKASDIIRD
jgi:low affinity Fe/Cu permease